MSPPIRYLVLLLLLAPMFAALSIAQTPSIDDFTMIGDTRKTEDECFQLTEEEDYSSGSIWYRQPISLREPFAIELSIMAGCKDPEGADGMVFMFASQPNRVGWRGEGIGFAGLMPSVGIELDTWRNYHLNDPAEDHLAFLFNGQVGHFHKESVPVLIPNIEDCYRHKLAILWDAASLTLSVTIDGREISAIRMDLVKSIFRGNDVVYWGVSAATGRYNNFHEVCFDRLSYVPPVPFQNNKANMPKQLFADRN